MNNVDWLKTLSPIEECIWDGKYISAGGHSADRDALPGVMPGDLKIKQAGKQRTSKTTDSTKGVKIIISAANEDLFTAMMIRDQYLSKRWSKWSNKQATKIKDLGDVQLSNPDIGQQD